jgi:DNA-binding response OmpR family regulator
MADILVAEDYPATRSALRTLLKSAGHTVRFAVNGEEALAQVALKRPDLLLLDVMMPKKSGYDVCREIRKTDPALPILMLTARGGESDKVLGLSLGADDYLAKPFGMRELLARISALLRRAYASETSGRTGEVFHVGGHTVDAARSVLVAPGGAETPLQPSELALLRLFAAHAGEVLTRERLLNEVWGTNYMGTTRTLDQRVAGIRKKLGADARVIETLYGRGYRYAFAFMVE